MTKMTSCCAILLTVLFITGCGSKEESAQEKAAPSGEADEQASRQEEPDFIVVQHILIGFQGSVPGKSITRSKSDASDLAMELLRRAQGGEDFDALVKEYTDDSHPGIYKMANRGIQADPSERVFARERMVPAFGDVGFPLDVGEIGLAEHGQNSPYGWHIIKRVE